MELKNDTQMAAEHHGPLLSHLANEVITQIGDDDLIKSIVLRKTDFVSLIGLQKRINTLIDQRRIDMLSVHACTLMTYDTMLAQGHKALNNCMFFAKDGERTVARNLLLWSFYASSISLYQHGDCAAFNTYYSMSHHGLRLATRTAHGPVSYSEPYQLYMYDRLRVTGVNPLVFVVV